MTKTHMKTVYEGAAKPELGDLNISLVNLYAVYMTFGSRSICHILVSAGIVY